MGFCHSCGNFAPILNPGALCITCFNLEKSGEISISSIEDQHRRLSKKIDPLSLNFLQDVVKKARMDADYASNLNSRADLFQNIPGSNQGPRTTRPPNTNQNQNQPFFQNQCKNESYNRP